MHTPKESLDKRTFSRPSTPNNSNLRCILNRDHSRISWDPPSPQDLSWNWSLSRRVEDPHDTQAWHLQIRLNQSQASSLLRYLVIGPFLPEAARHNAEHVHVLFALCKEGDHSSWKIGRVSDEDVDPSTEDVQNVWVAMTVRTCREAYMTKRHRIWRGWRYVENQHQTTQFRVPRCWQTAPTEWLTIVALQLSWDRPYSPCWVHVPRHWWIDSDVTKY